MIPNHVAIVGAGYDEWSRRTGRPLPDAWEAGAESTLMSVTTAIAASVRTLTIIPFPGTGAVPADAMVVYLDALQDGLPHSGARLSLAHPGSRTPTAVEGPLESLIEASRFNDELDLRIGLGYSGRGAIAAAARRLIAIEMAPGDMTPDRLDEHLASDVLPLDLLVLTGGHRTLADSLLWSSAYAELQFSPRPWPDADADWFGGLLADYASRDRRFGGVRDVTVPTRRKVG